MAITNGYTTLNDFKAYLFPSANYGTAEDAQMEGAIEVASRTIDAFTNRRFYSDSTVSARVYYVLAERLRTLTDVLTVTYNYCLTTVLNWTHQ